MDIVISQSSDKPIYTQIYEQIAGQILCGQISSGERLPPIRAVSANLQVSVIPVKKAWEQLERDGYITTQIGRGTFVSGLGKKMLQEKRSGIAAKIIEDAVRDCRELGLSCKEIVAIVKSKFPQS